MDRNAAEQIKARVTIADALRLYGYETNERRRIPCPIHNGKDGNFCYKDRVYHCWVCGAKGDVISLVEHLFGLSFSGAIEKLAGDFGLEMRSERADYRTQKKLRTEARIKRNMNAMYEERRRDYLNLCKLHAVLYGQLLRNLDKAKREPGNAELARDNEDLAEYVDNLDLFLDMLIRESEN
jgi:DNA primase